MSIKINKICKKKKKMLKLLLYHYDSLVKYLSISIQIYFKYPCTYKYYINLYSIFILIVLILLYYI